MRGIEIYSDKSVSSNLLAEHFWEEAVDIYYRPGSTAISLWETCIAIFEAIKASPEPRSRYGIHVVPSDEGSQNREHESASDIDSGLSRKSAESYDSSKEPPNEWRLIYPGAGIEPQDMLSQYDDQYE